MRIGRAAYRRALLSLGTAAAAMLAAVPAEAIDVVDIVSPRADAVELSGSVAVSVRTAPGVGRFRFYVRHAGEQKAVTSRFGPARGGVRTATLRFGPELARGRNHLYVSVRRPSGLTAVDAVAFTVARRRGRAGARGRSA